MTKINFKKVKEFINKYFIIEALIFTLLMILDLVSKSEIDKNMELYDSFVVIPHLFNFTYVRNTGAAFGMLQNAQWFFIVITFLALIVFGFLLFKFRKGHRLFKISLVLIIAGALGNLVDRLAFGYVRDFIEFAFWTDFAIFNFADAALTIGVVLFAIYLIFIYKEPKKKNETKPAFQSGINGQSFTAGEASASEPDSGSGKAANGEKHGKV